MGIEPAQRVRKNTSFTETLETGTCCCPSETRKGPIEPEKLQTHFPFVSPLQTVRAPDTEPPVSHDLQHDKGLLHDVHDSHATGEPSFLRGSRREKK